MSLAIKKYKTNYLRGTKHPLHDIIHGIYAKILKGMNFCVNYQFNLLYHDGIVVKTSGTTIPPKGVLQIDIRGCVYAVLQTIRMNVVYSVAYGIVHYKEPLKSFEIRVCYSHGFELPSVAILP